MTSSRALLVTAILTGCGAHPQSLPTPYADSASVTVAEGESADVSLLVSANEAVSVSVDAPADTDVEVTHGEMTNGNYPVKLAMRVGYGATGPRTATIHYRNADGEGQTTVTLWVKPVAWKKTLSWTTDGPQERERGALVFDAARSRVILIGGSGYTPRGVPLDDIWAWSLVDHTWSKPKVAGDLPTAASGRAVAMKDANTAYLFGGMGASPLDELVRVDLGPTIQFTKLAHSGGIPARSQHAFAIDPAETGARFVVFGGLSDVPLGDTWTAPVSDAPVWTRVATSSAPSARYGFFAGFAPNERRLVVFGGAQSAANVNAASDTWALDLARDTWSSIAATGAPTARHDGCAVFDPTSTRLFVFGGTADGKATEPGFFALDARPGKERWNRIERAGQPPLRSSAIGYWDETAHAATCGFGNTSDAVYRDFTSFGP